MTSVKPEYLRLLGSIILFALAMGLRLGAVNDTFVEDPIKSDAADYYTYAIHLKYYHTYSEHLPSDAPRPDAIGHPATRRFSYRL